MRSTTKRGDAALMLVYLVQTGVSGIIPLIVLPFITRVLKPAEFGEFSLSLAYSILLAGISSLGLLETTERNYYRHAENHGELAALVWGSMLVTTAIFAGLFVATFFGLEIIAGQLGITNISLLLWVAVGQLLATLSGIMLIVLRHEARAWHYTIISVLTSITNAVVSIIMVVFMHYGPFGLAYGLIAGALLSFILLSSNFLLRHGFRLSWRLIRRALRNAVWLLPRSFAGVLNTQIDKVIVGFIGSVSAVGVYAVGQRIAGGVFQYMTALQNVYSPGIYRLMLEKEKPRERGERVGTYLEPFFHFSVAGGAAIVLLAPWLIVLLTTAEYRDAEPVVILLSVLWVTLFFGKVAGPQLLGNDRTGLLSVQTYVYAFLNAIFCIGGAKLGGAPGAAAGATIAGTVNALFSAWLGQRQFRIVWDRKWFLTSYLLFMIVVASQLLRYMSRVDTHTAITVGIISTSLFLLLCIKRQVFIRVGMVLR